VFVGDSGGVFVGDTGGVFVGDTVGEVGGDDVGGVSVDPGVVGAAVAGFGAVLAKLWARSGWKEPAEYLQPSPRRAASPTGRQASHGSAPTS
jgi:hypothetical protein